MYTLSLRVVRNGDVPKSLLHVDDGLKHRVREVSLRVDGRPQHLRRDGVGSVQHRLRGDPARVANAVSPCGVEPLADVVPVEVEVGHDHVVRPLLVVDLAQDLGVHHLARAAGQNHALLDAAFRSKKNK